MGALTGTTFLFDPQQVIGKITLLAPTPVSPPEVLELLASALALRGYTLVESATGMWIVPAAQASPAAMRIEVMPLQYARADEVAYTLSFVAPPGVRVVPYFITNSVLISRPFHAVTELLGVLKEKTE